MIIRRGVSKSSFDTAMTGKTLDEDWPKAERTTAVGTCERRRLVASKTAFLVVSTFLYCDLYPVIRPGLLSPIRLFRIREPTDGFGSATQTLVYKF